MRTGFTASKVRQYFKTERGETVGAVWWSVCGCYVLTLPNTRLHDDIIGYKYDHSLQRGHTPFNNLNFEVYKFSFCLSVSVFLCALVFFCMPNCSLLWNFWRGTPPPKKQQACTLIKKMYKLKLRTTWAKFTPTHDCNIYIWGI